MAELFTNLATSTLASGISAAALSLTVQSGDGAKYPAPTGGDIFRAVLFKKSTGDVEIITCTARTADVLTITRAEEGTTALVLIAGDLVELRPTAAFFNALSDPSWGAITGTLGNQTDLQAALDLKAAITYVDSQDALKASLASPIFTGNPTAPTPAVTDNDTSVATTEYVKDVVAVTNSGTFVTDADAPVISETIFDIDANVTFSTWESIGETASGADNIWTALDGIPDDVDWIEVKGVVSATNSSGISVSIVLYARPNGSSHIANEVAAIAYTENAAAGNGASSITTTSSFNAKINITSKIFDLYWLPANASSRAIHMYLVGYGYN